MKIVMITPGWSSQSIWGHIYFRFPVLSLPAVAACTPIEHEVIYRDDNIEPIMIDEHVDLVAITAMTPLANRAYDIADAFRQRNIPVVLGGVHTTFCPEESLEHADAIVMGEAEQVWPELLDDLRNHRLQKRYQAPSLVDPSLIPPARRSILQKKKYFFTNLIQTTRGCPFDCEFCSVTSYYGGTYRCRPLQNVESELTTVGRPGSFLFIVDDNILCIKSYSRDLFSMLKGHSYKWLSHASINVAFTGDLLKEAAASGCIGLFVGFESLNKENLELMGKKVNRIEMYQEAITRFQDAGIGILGSFVVGYDHDDERTFDQLYEFTLKTKLDAALFTILTPFPGTRVRERLKRENRLISDNWSEYDMEHVVFKPALLSSDRLYEKWRGLTSEFHSVRSLVRRLVKPHRSLQFFIPANIGFRIGWNKCFRANKIEKSGE